MKVDGYVVTVEYDEPGDPIVALVNRDGAHVTVQSSDHVLGVDMIDGCRYLIAADEDGVTSVYAMRV
jgi:hypothetical protein